MTAQTITHRLRNAALPNNFLLLHFCAPTAGNTDICEVFPGSSTWHPEILQGNSGSNQFCGAACGKSRLAEWDAGLKMWLVRDNEGEGRQLKRRKVTI